MVALVENGLLDAVELAGSGETHHPRGVRGETIEAVALQAPSGRRRSDQAVDDHGVVMMRDHVVGTLERVSRYRSLGQQIILGAERLDIRKRDAACRRGDDVLEQRLDAAV